MFKKTYYTGVDSFVELHARSAFHFLHGVSHPEDLVERAGELGMGAIAICDRGGVYGSARAHARAKQVGLRAIVGSEFAMEDGSLLPVLVESRAGYENLCQLQTRAALRSPKGEGQVGWEELGEFAEGLVCLGGRNAGRLVEIFGQGNVYVELNRHHLRGERRRVQELVDLARGLGLPLLASNVPIYHEAGRRGLADAFTCLRNHTTLDRAGTLLAVNSQNYLKGHQEMAALFADLPEAIANTGRLAERLEFTLADLGYRFPDYPTADGETMGDVLRRETYAGAAVRYGKITEKVRKQLDHELAIIGRLGFCGYFLIVREITLFAQREEILCQGRGSAANSAVCYSLGITNVDPIGGGLLFERFLSEGRQGWPDIDIDFPSGERREAVIQEVFRKYSPRGAAMTANVITYRGRSAMREMGKVLGVPENVLDRFSKIAHRAAIKDDGELQEELANAGLSGKHPRVQPLMKLYRAVYGLPRHLGQHSGGMIISDRPLDTVVPLENASMPGRVVVQWDKDDCEDLGIIKVDLLGLGMLAAMQDTVEICQTRGRPVDLAQLPKDDSEVYAMLTEADTIGLFQVESRAQMATLPRMKPRCFYDLVIEIALIRPGPIVGDLVHPYLNRREGKEPVDFIDPRFEPALKRTLGVPLFQEQILRMAMIIADFTGSEAEELRRAMSFNRSEERMQRVMSKLRAAMAAKGVTTEVQDRIVGSIQSFALYGFPESHAISFALIAYASAWLKVHRPEEFYVGLLNNQPMGFYNPATLLRDAKARGLRILPVQVNVSGYGCHVERDGVIRLGLLRVRELGRETARRIVEERESGGSYGSAEDLFRRVRPDVTERRALAKAGALNGLGELYHRREALWEAEESLVEEDLFSWGRKTAEEKSGVVAKKEIPLPPMTPIERLRADYDSTGVTVGSHPMAYIREQLPGILRAQDIGTRGNKEEIWCGGLVICRQRPGSAKGHVFISLEDETGIANLFVPGKTFEKYRLVITQEPFLRVRGRVQKAGPVLSVYTEHVEALGTVPHVGVRSHDFH